MTNYYATRNYKPNHCTFGGVIYNYDFGGHTTMSDIASDIISDWNFDKRCKQDAENRDKNMNYEKGIK